MIGTLKLATDLGVVNTTFGMVNESKNFKHVFKTLKQLVWDLEAKFIMLGSSARFSNQTENEIREHLLKSYDALSSVYGFNKVDYLGIFELDTLVDRYLNKIHILGVKHALHYNLVMEEHSLEDESNWRATAVYHEDSFEFIDNGELRALTKEITDLCDRITRHPMVFMAHNFINKWWITLLNFGKK